MAFPSSLSVPTHLHREGEEVEERTEQIQTAAADREHETEGEGTGGEEQARRDSEQTGK